MEQQTSANSGIYNAVQTITEVTQQNRDQVLTELLDRQRIGEVMLRFGRGLDLHDWDMYAATLDDEFDVDFTDLTGMPPARSNPKDWAEFASVCLERLVVHHQYSNFSIDISGDEAVGVFYYIARHRMPSRHGGDDYTQYGWYDNSFRKTDSGWKITKLKHSFQWCDGNPTLIDVTDPQFQAAAGKIFEEA